MTFYNPRLYVGGRAGRYRRVASRRNGASMSTYVGAAILILLAAGTVLLGLSTLKMERLSQVDSLTGCPLHVHSPMSVLMLADRTDPLLPSNEGMVRGVFRHYERQLPRYGRLLVSSFTGGLADDLTPAYDRCSPGKAEDGGFTAGARALQASFQSEFDAPLWRTFDKMMVSSTDAQSPIAEQIERLIADPAVAAQADHQTFVLMSDGLENTEASPVYKTGRIVLPKTHPGILKGVAVDFVLLPNPRHPGLQTDALKQAWVQWFFEEGAASVCMHAPGMACAA